MTPIVNRFSSGLFILLVLILVGCASSPAPRARTAGPGAAEAPAAESFIIEHGKLLETWTASSVELIGPTKLATGTPVFPPSANRKVNLVLLRGVAVPRADIVEETDDEFFVHFRVGNVSENRMRLRIRCGPADAVGVLVPEWDYSIRRLVLEPDDAMDIFMRLPRMGHRVTLTVAEES